MLQGQLRQSFLGYMHCLLQEKEGENTVIFPRPQFYQNPSAYPTQPTKYAFDCYV